MIVARLLMLLGALMGAGLAALTIGAVAPASRGLAALLCTVFIATHVVWTWRVATQPPYAGRGFQRALLLVNAALLLAAPALIGVEGAFWRLGLVTAATMPLLAASGVSPRGAALRVALLSISAAAGVALGGAALLETLETLLVLGAAGSLAVASVLRTEVPAPVEPDAPDDPPTPSDSMQAAAIIVSSPPVITTRRPPAGERSPSSQDSLIAQLAVTREELESARASNRYKSSFLANMTHDLRTPLNSIIGYAEMLAEDTGDMPEDVVADLHTIRDAASGMLEIINDVMDISKIEAGRMTINYQEFEVSPFLKSIDAAVAPLGKGLGVPFVLRASPILGRIKTDRVKLRRILQNLLSNAFKFTTEGSVTLQVDLVKLGEVPWFSFAIIDSGAGIPADRVDDLFAPFVQIDERSNDKHAGSGLGLALVKHYTQALGGRVEVESEVGVGSTFTVLLPRRPIKLAVDGAMMISVN